MGLMSPKNFVGSSRPEAGYYMVANSRAVIEKTKKGALYPAMVLSLTPIDPDTKKEDTERKRGDLSLAIDFSLDKFGIGDAKRVAREQGLGDENTHIWSIPADPPNPVASNRAIAIFLSSLAEADEEWAEKMAEDANESCIDTGVVKGLCFKLEFKADPNEKPKVVDGKTQQPFLNAVVAQVLKGGKSKKKAEEENDEENPKPKKKSGKVTAEGEAAKIIAKMVESGITTAAKAAKSFPAYLAKIDSSVAEEVEELFDDAAWLKQALADAAAE